jgi:hypothetical protein
LSFGTAVSRELTEDELRAVASLLDAVGLPADASTAVPGFAAFLESVAVARRLARRRRERPVAYAIALTEACRPLGIAPETYAKRVSRWAARWWPSGAPPGSRTICPTNLPTLSTSSSSR